MLNQCGAVKYCYNVASICIAAEHSVLRMSIMQVEWSIMHKFHSHALGLKQCTALELWRIEYSMQYSKCSKCSKYSKCSKCSKHTNLVQKYCACARTHFALTLALQILGIEQYCSIHFSIAVLEHYSITTLALQILGQTLRTQ